MYTLLIVDIVNKKRQLVDAVTLPKGLTRIQWQVLAHLHFEPEPMTQKTLNTLIDLDAGFIARVLEVLEKRGCIKRNISQHDRRQRDIFLTAKGKKSAVYLAEEVKKINKNFLSGLSAAEKKQLFTLTEKVQENVNRLCGVTK